MPSGRVLPIGNPDGPGSAGEVGVPGTWANPPVGPSPITAAPTRLGPAASPRFNTGLGVLTRRSPGGPTKGVILHSPFPSRGPSGSQRRAGFPTAARGLWIGLGPAADTSPTAGAVTRENESERNTRNASRV